MADPQYRRIAEDLRRRIKSKELRPGDKLPTEIELSHEYDASRSTLRDAIKSLISLGLVETRPGVGTFVAEKTAPLVTTHRHASRAIRNQIGYWSGLRNAVTNTIAIDFGTAGSGLLSIDTLYGVNQGWGGLGKLSVTGLPRAGSRIAGQSVAWILAEGIYPETLSVSIPATSWINTGSAWTYTNETCHSTADSIIVTMSRTCARKVLLWLIDSLLIALRLALVRAAFAGQAIFVSFALRIIAARLQYGLRREPGDDDSLRYSQISVVNGEIAMV